MAENEAAFPPFKVSRKSGAERFHGNGKPLDLSLFGFWQWSASDLLSNATRGVLAEYIVASALGTAGGVRGEWDAYDLLTESGLKVEVKSAAYLQSWRHEKLSEIRFDIRPTRKWDAKTNELSAEIKRQADVYVFCVLAHKKKNSVDPLDMEQWQFHVLPASELNKSCGGQKTIGLRSLLKLRPSRVRYEEIASCVEEMGRT